MQAGKLRHRVLIEKPVQVKSGTGAVTTTWVLFKPMWASIETLRLYERNAVAASWPGADVKIGMRFVVGVLPIYRITFNGKIYSILGVNNVEERNRELEITAQTGMKSL